MSLWNLWVLLNRELQISGSWENGKNVQPEYLDRNWNEEFQKMNEEKHSPSKFERLSQLAHDFVYAAKLYGKIICSEVCLPEDRKTIKPTLIGGRAGKKMRNLKQKV